MQAIPLLWWFRPVMMAGAARRAERRRVHVVEAEAVGREPIEGRRRDRAAEAAELAEARVVEDDEQDVRGSLRALSSARARPGSIRPPCGRSLLEMGTRRGIRRPACGASLPASTGVAWHGGGRRGARAQTECRQISTERPLRQAQPSRFGWPDSGPARRPTGIPPGRATLGFRAADGSRPTPTRRGGYPWHRLGLPTPGPSRSRGRMPRA